jgi:translation initiation factor IF-1
MPGNSPTFKITMKEYEDMAIKVGDKVEIEIKKVDDNRT